MKTSLNAPYLVDLADDGTAESWSEVLGLPIHLLREAAAMARPSERLVPVPVRPRSRLAGPNNRHVGRPSDKASRLSGALG
jgi:hypothetical protein